VVNTDYDTTNSLYSLWLTRDRLRGGFVVLNGDVLFHDQLLGDLLTSRDEDALLMAAHRGEDYSDEEMKIRVRAGCVADIAKTLPPADTDGENVGIAKFGAEGATVLVEALDEAVAGWRRDASFPAACLRDVCPPPAAARRRNPRISLDRNRLPETTAAPAPTSCRRLPAWAISTPVRKTTTERRRRRKSREARPPCMNASTTCTNDRSI
jgi:hypothetical protein